MGDPNLAFIRHKSRHAISFSLANLQRLDQHPCAVMPHQPLAGRTAFVVGAGPSLAQNGELLRQANEAGACVVSVNASDPALRSMGVRADVMVARESIDFSAEVEASEAAMIALDIAAHPAAWTVAGQRAAWFVPDYPRHLHLCQRLGIRPLDAGSSALCSAVALVTSWGAERVVLVGVDLALGKDGSAYHQAAPRGDCRGQVVNGRVVFSGNVRNDEITRASGQVTQPKVVALDRVPASDFSGWLPTIDVWRDQREWLEQHAERYGGHREFVNCTEGGAGIVGWRTGRLSDVLAASGIAQDPVEIPAWYPVDEGMREQLVADLLHECDVLESVSRQQLADSGPDLVALRSLDVYGAPLVETLAAWRTIDAPTAGGEERCRYVYGAFLDASTEARGILGGGAA